MIKEGYIPFREFKTYYRIAGAQYHKAPLILIHGGPGSTHNYFEVLDKAADLCEMPFVMYDQIGCGKSYVEGHDECWNMTFWMDELDNLLDKLNITQCHLLGQSWGGMLTLNYVCNHDSDNILSIILSSTLPSSEMWGNEQTKMIKELPLKYQKAIEDAFDRNDYTGSMYLEAVDVYMQKHCSGPFDERTPECVKRVKKSGTRSYEVAWGANEFRSLGTLKNYDVTAQLKDIKQPALVISGENDLCTPYIAQYMADHIPYAKWELFEKCRHMCFVEDNDRYVKLLKGWFELL